MIRSIGLLALACAPTTKTTDTDCETLPGTCGQAALNDSESGDTGCPEGFQCWGPSVFVCYRGAECELPSCLPPDAAVSTPHGPVALRDLRVGDPVYTVDAAGRPVVAPVERLGSVRAPADHERVVVRLSDGRVVSGSPGHPTADGRSLGALRGGDRLDGAQVTSVERSPYPYGRTYDLRPAGATGAYVVDDVALGSTLTGR